MHNPEIVIDQACLDTYIKLNRKYHFKVNMNDSKNGNISYIANEIKTELGKFGHSDIEITDILVKHLYCNKNSKSKESLWFCYGDIIVDNLKRNIGEDTTVCQKCGKRFKRETINEKYCVGCRGYEPIETKTITCIDCGKRVETTAWDMKTCRCDDCQKLADYTPIETKIIKCIDCGIEFEVDGIVKKQIRCSDCYETHRQNKNREKALRYYHNNKQG